MKDIPNQLIHKYIDEGAFSGAALVVAKNNHIVHEYYAGHAAPNLPSGPNVLFPIASISKVYTAAMIMRLVEMGELTLSSHVFLVLPKFVGEGREAVRLRHLLTHTSGLPYESPEMEQRLIQLVPMSALIEEAYTAPLQSTPGTTFNYADYNYLLAGHMAEVATGKPFAELIQNLVIEPMGLKNTYMPPPSSEHERIAKVKAVMAEGTDGAMYNSAHALSLAHPAFGTVCTATDLVHFAQHFVPQGPRIHKEITIKAMTTNQAGFAHGSHVALTGLAADVRPPWGLGFGLQTEVVPGLYTELGSFRTFGHGGASGCLLIIDPKINLIVAILTNTHARIGRERWYRRLQSMVNASFACYG
jgi:beta-lactamase class C